MFPVMFKIAWLNVEKLDNMNKLKKKKKKERKIRKWENSLLTATPQR